MFSGICYTITSVRRSRRYPSHRSWRNCRHRLPRRMLRWRECKISRPRGKMKVSKALWSRRVKHRQHGQTCHNLSTVLQRIPMCRQSLVTLTPHIHHPKLYPRRHRITAMQNLKTTYDSYHSEWNQEPGAEACGGSAGGDFRPRGKRKCYELQEAGPDQPASTKRTRRKAD